MPDFGSDPVSIDVGRLVRRNVASLYSSLVTRPTGQAVRLAIENVLAEETGPISLSVIDLSQVTVIDFSCADEVVAKLLLRFLEEGSPEGSLLCLPGDPGSASGSYRGGPGAADPGSRVRNRDRGPSS